MVFDPARDMMLGLITKINKDIMDMQALMDKKKKLAEDIQKNIREIDDLLGSDPVKAQEYTL